MCLPSGSSRCRRRGDRAELDPHAQRGGSVGAVPLLSFCCTAPRVLSEPRHLKCPEISNRAKRSVRTASRLPFPRKPLVCSELELGRRCSAQVDAERVHGSRDSTILVPLHSESRLLELQDVRTRYNRVKLECSINPRSARPRARISSGGVLPRRKATSTSARGAPA